MQWLSAHDQNGFVMDSVHVGSIYITLFKSICVGYDPEYNFHVRII